MVFSASSVFGESRMPFRCNSSSVSMTESSGVPCHPPIRHLFFSSATLDSTFVMAACVSSSVVLSVCRRFWNLTRTNSTSARTANSFRLERDVRNLKWPRSETYCKCCKMLSLSPMMAILRSRARRRIPSNLEDISWQAEQVDIIVVS